MRISILLFALVIYTVPGLFAQVPSINRLYTTNALPGYEIHSIFQDEKGFLWLATNGGICRYDGERLLTYNQQNGLPENGVLNFFFESADRVWLYTISRKLYVFNPLSRTPTFQPFLHQDSLEKAVSKVSNSSFIRKMYFSDDGKFYFTFLTTPGYLVIDSKTGGFETKGVDCCQDMNPLNSDLWLEFYNQSPYFSYTHFEKPIGNSAPGKLLIKLHDKIKEPMPSVSGRFNSFYGVSDYCRYGDTTITIIGRRLIAVADDTTCVRYMDAEGICIANKPGGGFYVGTYKGLYEFDAGLNLKCKLLPNSIVTDIFEDRAGTFWFTTHFDGVYYIQLNHLHRLNNSSDEVFSGVHLYPPYITLISPAKEILVYNTIKDDAPLRITETTYSRSGIFMSNTDGLEKYLGSQILSGTSKGYVYSDHFDDDSLLLTFSPNFIGFVTTDTAYNMPFPLKSYVLHQYQLNDSVQLLGTRDGLYRLTHLNIEKILFAPVLSDIAVKKIAIFRNHVLLALDNQGLAVLRDDVLVYHLTEQDGLLSNNINDISVDDEDNIWLGTSNGVNRVSVDKFTGIEVNAITAHVGLPHDNVFSLTVFNDTVWVTTQGGFCFFNTGMDLNPVYNDVISGFSIDSVKADGTLISKGYSAYEVPYNALVEIYFSNLLLPSQQNCTVEYASAFSENWTAANNHKITFKANEEGNTEVRFRLRYFKQVLDTHSISFDIAVPFWKTWWFILLVLLGISGYLVLLSFVFKHFRNKRKLRELERTKLELKALIAQMNPHFTFNTMNSIQAYLINHSSEDGILYLSDFAALIRKTLEYSRSEFISIAEELKFLAMYINLEQRRFRFKITLKTDLNIIRSEEQLLIPPFLLQPLVENAIVHSLSGIENAMIHIGITEVSGGLEVLVYDNGNPDQKGLAHKSTEKPVALQIVRERIRLLNNRFYKEEDLQMGFDLRPGISGWMTIIRLRNI